MGLAVLKSGYPVVLGKNRFESIRIERGANRFESIRTAESNRSHFDSHFTKDLNFLPEVGVNFVYVTEFYIEFCGLRL